MDWGGKEGVVVGQMSVGRDTEGGRWWWCVGVSVKKGVRWTSVNGGGVCEGEGVWGKEGGGIARMTKVRVRWRGSKARRVLLGRLQVDNESCCGGGQVSGV